MIACTSYLASESVSLLTLTLLSLLCAVKDDRRETCLRISLDVEEFFVLGDSISLSLAADIEGWLESKSLFKELESSF